MKICIIETSPISDNPIDAHIRNSIEIQKFLSKKHYCILTASNKYIPYEKFDIILFSYASFYFDFKAFENLINLNTDAKIGWITNEYNLVPNSFFYKKIDFIISGFEQKGSNLEKFNKYCFVNINTLLYRGVNPQINKKYDLVYYGTFRPDREKYFKKYIQPPLILSTSSKNHKKYKDIGCGAKVMQKMDWTQYRETLNLFKASLYIEDEYTHRLFNNLANRFYEGLTCNNAIFFDDSCMSTINKSKNIIDEFFIVRSLDEINLKLQHKDFNNKTKQFLDVNNEIAKQERIDTLNTINDFIESL